MTHTYRVLEHGTEVWRGEADSTEDAINLAYDGITDDDCGDLSADELREAAVAEKVPHHCECGRITGEYCDWHGPEEDCVTIEWMPPCFRASHEAAGNSGVWPHNGSEQLLVAPTCADMIMESEDGWVSLV